MGGQPPGPPPGRQRQFRATRRGALAPHRSRAAPPVVVRRDGGTPPRPPVGEAEPVLSEAKGALHLWSETTLVGLSARHAAGFILQCKGILLTRRYPPAPAPVPRRWGPCRARRGCSP